MGALLSAVMTYQQPQQPGPPYQPPPQPGYQQQGYPQQQAGYPQGYPQPGYPPRPQQAVTTIGLPGWMHALYAVGTFFTCGLLLAVWIPHAIMAKRKVTTTIQ